MGILSFSILGGLLWYWIAQRNLQAKGSKISDGGGLVILVSAIGFVIAMWILTRDIDEPLSIDVGSPLMVVIALFYMSRRLHGHWAAGDVLLDVAPAPHRRFFYFVAAVYFLSTLSLLVRWESSWPMIAIMGFVILMSAWSFIADRSRVQLCEQGILTYSRLVRSERIDTYSWSDNEEFMGLRGLYWAFIYQTKGSNREHRLPVPRERKQEFEEIVARCCKPQTVAADEVAGEQLG